MSTSSMNAMQDEDNRSGVQAVSVRILERSREAIEFFQNCEKWNSIVNIHLLQFRNKSRHDCPFAN